MFNCMKKEWYEVVKLVASLGVIWGFSYLWWNTTAELKVQSDRIEKNSDVVKLMKEGFILQSMRGERDDIIMLENHKKIFESQEIIIENQNKMLQDGKKLLKQLEKANEKR